jgi:hypothetical protein
VVENQWKKKDAPSASDVGGQLVLMEEQWKAWSKVSAARSHTGVAMTAAVVVAVEAVVVGEVEVTVMQTLLHKKDGKTMVAVIGR